MNIRKIAVAVMMLCMFIAISDCAAGVTFDDNVIQSMLNFAQ